MIIGDSSAESRLGKSSKTAKELFRPAVRSVAEGGVEGAGRFGSKTDSGNIDSGREYPPKSSEIEEDCIPIIKKDNSDRYRGLSVGNATETTYHLSQSLGSPFSFHFQRQTCSLNQIIQLIDFRSHIFLVNLSEFLVVQLRRASLKINIQVYHWASRQKLDRAQLDVQVLLLF